MLCTLNMFIYFVLLIHFGHSTAEREGSALFLLILYILNGMFVFEAFSFLLQY